MTYDLETTTLLYQVQDVLTEEASPRDRHLLLGRVIEARAEIGPVSLESEELPVWSMLTCCAAELLLKSNRPKTALKLLHKVTQPDGVLHRDSCAQSLWASAENKLGRSQEVVDRLAPLLNPNEPFEGDPSISEAVGIAHANLNTYHLAHKVLWPFVQEGEALCRESGAQRIVSQAMLKQGSFKKHQDHFGNLLAEGSPFYKDAPLQIDAAHALMRDGKTKQGMQKLEPFVLDESGLFFENIQAQVAYSEACKAANRPFVAIKHMFKLMEQHEAFRNNRDIVNGAGDALLACRRSQEAIDLLDPWVEMECSQKSSIETVSLYFHACGQQAMDPQTGLTSSQKKNRLWHIVTALEAWEESVPKIKENKQYKEVQKYLGWQASKNGLVFRKRKERQIAPSV